MALDFDDIKSDIGEIIAIGDEALASSKIISLQDKITNEIAETSATIKSKNDEIEALKNQLENKQKENDEIRKNNKDLLLKYGELVQNTHPIEREVEQEEENPEAKLSWADIAHMD